MKRCIPEVESVLCRVKAIVKNLFASYGTSSFVSTMISDQAADDGV
jgi:hypothetical protein